MADYVTVGGEGLDAHRPTRSTVHAITLTGAPARAAVAASLLRQFVDRASDEHPTRDELRADVETVLDERLRLYGRINDLERDREASKSLHGQQVREIAKLRESRDSARNLRDEYHEAYHAAENERNTLARENAQLRRHCAPSTPGGVAQSDLDM